MIETEKELDELFPIKGFISYRKKDREHLLELKEIMRSLPFTENISLWFDDALIPGEDYHDEIKNQMS